MLFDFFRKGINLGGYLSQYEIVTEAASAEAMEKHLETFITKKDIEQIASWGFDHVRIPMDGYLFFDREKKELMAEPMAYLDRCLGWCADYGLSAVVDLHNFWGHVFGQMEQPTLLMTDEAIREDFCSFWEKMAEHFAGFEKTKLMFELFNEMADATGYRWNQLYKAAIGRIRQKDETRWILVGSNYVNSVAWLDRMDLVSDSRVFYNFHYYEPNAFTHQRAHFSEEFCKFPKGLTYPGDMSGYLAFLSENPKYQKEHPLITAETVFNDRALMEKLMKPAKDFMDYSGCELYCGEFGVIDSAPEAEAIKWMGDFIDCCDDWKIGHAMWNYKCLDFELVDMDGNVVRPDILELLQKKNK